MLDIERAREDIPMLMEELRDINPHGYEYISDVFSEVLKQLRQNQVKDPTMVGWLYESIDYHRSKVASA